jgi:DNA-binding transcriptional ArsR family regulator
VVEHDARLGILCCLADGEALAVEQVSDRTGMQPRQTKHHMQILDVFGIVRRTRKGESGQAIYVLRLDEQPRWVREAVEAHRRVAAE